MELIGVLKTTGGTPGVRRHLFRFLDSMEIPHDHSIYTARAVFAIIEASLEENTGSDMINLYEPLQDIVDGKVRSLRSVKHLRNSVLSLMGELNDGKKSLALASAVITPILDEGDTYSLLPLDESELYSIVSEYDDDIYYPPPTRRRECRRGGAHRQGECRGHSNEEAILQANGNHPGSVVHTSNFPTPYRQYFQQHWIGCDNRCTGQRKHAKNPSHRI